MKFSSPQSDHVSSKPLKSILKKRLKIPAHKRLSPEKIRKSFEHSESSNESVNSLRLHFRKRFSSKLLNSNVGSDHSSNHTDDSYLDLNVEPEERQIVEQAVHQAPRFGLQNDDAIEALRNIGDDVIIWMQLTREMTRHTMIHLSVNFPMNLVGEQVIRWMGEDPEIDAGWTFTHTTTTSITLFFLTLALSRFFSNSPLCYHSS